MKLPEKVRTRRPAPGHPPQPHEEKVSLGLAGNLARTFITSPLSPMLLIASLFIGILGLLFTPRQEDPEISVPMIDIFISYPGVSPQQVASLAIDPLERIMSDIPGVKHVYSASERGQGMVTVRFKVGEKLGPSIVKVHDKLQSNLDRIPPGVSMPLVKPKGIDDVPVVTVTLWSEEVDDSTLRVLATDVLQRLKEVPNTGQGFVAGGRSQQIRIEVLPERLAGYNISLDQIARTIRAANEEKRVGTIEKNTSHFTITSGHFLKSGEEVGRLVIGTHDGAPIYVADIANVVDGEEVPTRMVNYFSGPAGSSDKLTGVAPAVTIAIAKKEGTNGVTVAEDILAKLESLKGRLVPDNINVEITRNYGKTANDKVNELLTSLLGAAIAVSLLSWITIGRRPAVVVITIIPIVILITIWSAWVMGYTINRVSLFALIFSIGILVDDATVVVENIFRRWLHDGETRIDTAVDAVREVGNPTIIATLTVLSALLPMGFVSGMMGPYMFPIPLFGSVAMAFSLFAAFVFTPWFAYKLRPKMNALNKAAIREEKTQDLIGNIFRPVIEPLIQSKFKGRVFLAVIVVLFFAACSMFYTKAVAVKMLPFDNKPEFNVVINLPEGTPLPTTASFTFKLVDALKGVEEITAMQSYVGTVSPFNFNGMVRHYYLRMQPWQSDIQVMLLDKGDRERSSHEIAESARALLTPIAEKAGAKIAVVEMPPGPPVLQTMVAEVYGPDEETRRQVAHDMEQMFIEAPGLVDVDTYMADANERWHFEVDTEKVTRLGVDVETINRNLDMAMGGYILGDAKRGRGLEPTHLVIELPLHVRSQLPRLHNLPIPTSAGGTVPLTELGHFVSLPEDPILYHKDLRPMEYVVGEMEGKLGAPIYGIMAVEDLLDHYTAPDGVSISGTMMGPPADDMTSGFEWSGEWVVTYETFRDMGLAFAAALVLIIILLVWEFGNFIHPAIIMAPIPLTLIGIIPGHWIMDAEFTATSMIGFIALAGIEVRNSILLVDFARNEVHRGTHHVEAVVTAGQIRMRPIWVTDLTMMAGAAAIILDPIFEGMAISLLFGPIVAVPLTMIVVPLGCISACNAFKADRPAEDDNNGYICEVENDGE
ncbi:efflux RND transporter permease subunit [Solemya velum gill symbiont]|uniref:efflux RND transporter permease subunit n=1 Tax=Solemya velum gill symbiont TaxID=2340 RepID=UPI0009986641|nr:efflux RND transporter permease subunit [Solemya velum gill symbiont]OOY53786.1 acriflavin resistance protein [Solemya velum gill symbiont]OOY57584.1 acriflavin resistance protein [Solemya velum gill symbiont]OOY58608.1 acriflavin resistance protein [Solemya velum gill symbiont]OOY61244.1 acriflavin resistance protein [Solemya velum gill symbiont]OOY62773.1 acriflavin resistance protein [Solemya velum gill symbiont]